jgi:hypothetical protein
MFQQGLGYSTLHGMFAPLVDCSTCRHPPSVHHQRNRLCARAAVEEQISRPLQQQLTALFSAAALLASDLSMAGMQVAFGMCSTCLY